MTPSIQTTNIKMIAIEFENFMLDWIHWGSTLEETQFHEWLK